MTPAQQLSALQSDEDDPDVTLLHFNDMREYTAYLARKGL